jgi:hypothetical protein
MQRPDNSEDREDREDSALKAPPELVAALKRLEEPRFFIPPTVDEAVGRAARQHLEGRQGRRAQWLRWMPWLATAAGFAIVVASLSLLPARTEPTSKAKPATGMSLTHSGPVDILDAYALARQLKSRAVPNVSWDVNRDGVVDERDVATLAAQAVRLERGGGT